MKEAESREVSAREKRSQRPPKPLTHKLDKRALQEAYYKAGLQRPELTKRRERSDKRNAPKRRASNRGQEIKTMDGDHAIPGTDQRTGTKPGVPGTGQAQQQDESFNVKCAKGGATAFITGLALMLSYKLLGRWL